MSNQAVTFLVSRLAVATVEFLIVGFLVAGLLVLLPQIGPRWRRRIWFLALCKPFVTVLTGFWGGFVPLAPFVNGTLLGDILFPARAGSTSLTESSASSTVIHVVAYAWMLITLAMLIRVAVRALASRQVAEDHLAKGYLLKPTTIKRLDAKLSVPPQARIIITPEEAGPATLGVFRPAVIIPESLLPWVLRHRDPTPQERDRLCQVLRHELAHIAHRDDLVTLITLVMLSFFWFHPVAHWAYRRVRMNNELCCDEDVVRSGVRPADYVDTLMGIVAGQFSRRGFSLHMIGDSAPVGVLRKRLHYVLRERRELEPRRPWAAYVMVGVMLLALPRFLGLGGLIEVTTVGGEGMLVTQAELHPHGAGAHQGRTYTRRGGRIVVREPAGTGRCRWPRPACRRGQRGLSRYPESSADGHPAVYRRNHGALVGGIGRRRDRSDRCERRGYACSHRFGQEQARHRPITRSGLARPAHARWLRSGRSYPTATPESALAVHRESVWDWIFCHRLLKPFPIRSFRLLNAGWRGPLPHGRGSDHCSAAPRVSAAPRYLMDAGWPEPRYSFAPDSVAPWADVWGVKSSRCLTLS
jgi:beta-lactamase regulating signal transducer with metallopeptidase domain